MMRRFESQLIFHLSSFLTKNLTTSHRKNHRIGDDREKRERRASCCVAQPKIERRRKIVRVNKYLLNGNKSCILAVVAFLHRKWDSTLRWWSEIHSFFMCFDPLTHKKHNKQWEERKKAARTFDHNFSLRAFDYIDHVLTFFFSSSHFNFIGWSSTAPAVLHPMSIAMDFKWDFFLHL